MNCQNVSPHKSKILISLIPVFDQLLATALLLLMLISISDERNSKGDDISGLFPFLMAVGLAGILSSFALNSGAAINPAKDFSP